MLATLKKENKVNIPIAITLVLILSFFLISFQATKAIAESTAFSTTKVMPYSVSLNTYADNKDYSGTKVTPQVSSDKIANFCVVSSGGEQPIYNANGNKTSDIAYSNYVYWTLNLNLNGNKEISSTDVKISNDTAKIKSIFEKNEIDYTKSDKYKEHKVNYGVLVAIRMNGDGTKFQYEPIYNLDGSTNLAECVYNEVGDYKIYYFFETKNGNTYRNNILIYSFKIRAKIYLKDAISDYDVKDNRIYYNSQYQGVETGIYNKNTKVDFAGRVGLSVLYAINGSAPASLTDGAILSNNGTYTFTVSDNGFVCEKFSFIIDKSQIDRDIHITNLNRLLATHQTDEGELYVYGAEGFISITWDTNNKSCTYTFNDENGFYGNQIPYTKGDILDKAGYYYITARTETQIVYYIVQISSYDNPSYNYSQLNQKRFNNFIPKWIEVFNELNGEYLCFDVTTETRRAYEAAMTIENSHVTDLGGSLIYKGRTYSNRIDLTAAMNTNAQANMKITYFDPTSNKVEKIFSPILFDGTIYLNPEFVFVSKHKTEVETVTLITTDGSSIIVELGASIAKQDLPEGKYTCSEKDCYGNETTYTVYIDKTAPVITVEGNKISIFDKYDNYPVLVVDGVYYYNGEWENISLSTGLHTIRAYDRNENMTLQTISVGGNA